MVTQDDTGGRLRGADGSVRYVERVAADRATLEALLLECYPFARSVALMLARNAHEAEDLVQEAMARALRTPPAQPSVPVLRAWLRQTIARELLRKRRRAATEAKALLRILVEPPPVPASSQASADLLAALRKLPPRQRAAVVLRYVHDLPEEEVAATLGVAVGTAKAHLAQAREKLRKLLR